VASAKPFILKVLESVPPDKFILFLMKAFALVMLLLILSISGIHVYFTATQDQFWLKPQKPLAYFKGNIHPAGF
jgi:hypothetical protein